MHIHYPLEYTLVDIILVILYMALENFITVALLFSPLHFHFLQL